MAKLPELDSLNWGEIINNFLSQALDPESGSINVWEESDKPGGITGLAGIERGKCGWNLTKGCLERFDGTRWVELRSHIRDVPTPLITSNDNTIPNTEWVTRKINKAVSDFLSGTLNTYLTTLVKDIVRNEIIPEVNLIMETYKTLHQIAASPLPTTQTPSISLSPNTEGDVFDVHITFDPSKTPTVGIYVSVERGIWMGYDRFLSKDLVGQTLLSAVKDRQGSYIESGTLLGVNIEQNWVLHLISNPNNLTQENFQDNILATTQLSYIPLADK